MYEQLLAECGVAGGRCDVSCVMSDVWWCGVGVSLKKCK